LRDILENSALELSESADIEADITWMSRNAAQWAGHVDLTRFILRYFGFRGREDLRPHSQKRRKE
jgi:hypothetical protein